MSVRSRRPQPLKRKGFWYLNRRVPIEYAVFEKSDYVKVSTSIRIADDPLAIRAKEVAARLDAELLTHWRRLGSRPMPIACHGIVRFSNHRQSMISAPSAFKRGSPSFICCSCSGECPCHLVTSAITRNGSRER